MGKMDWDKANRNAKPKDDGKRKNFIEYRADRYLEAVDQAQTKSVKKQRGKA